VLTDSKDAADYYEACVAECEAPEAAANWIMNEVLRVVKEQDVSLSEFQIPPARLGGLVRLLEEGKINASVARDIMDKMMETGKDAATLVEEEGAEQIGEESELEPVVEQVIEENPGPVQDYLQGKKQAVGPLVGQVMRQTQGKADPKLAREMLCQKLDEMR
jgi:aspartyl-tRNA(Asn)/glutamyl-tRNA(Gln) amidotransferase subunit B